ncbi:hypothetical protein [Photobacterium sanguinicancri]|uniref:hypothetical protein n=1 Tax=Photobacterium sanguinicancri TaxID=875932 RepID=UPI00248005ED|nr:hypothetical protein [Photobacterium sanguinicancri]
MARGGARSGAGRKPGEATKRITVPVSKLTMIEKILAGESVAENQRPFGIDDISSLVIGYFLAEHFGWAFGFKNDDRYKLCPHTVSGYFAIWNDENLVFSAEVMTKDKQIELKNLIRNLGIEDELLDWCEANHEALDVVLPHSKRLHCSEINLRSAEKIHSEYMAKIQSVA